MPVYLSLHTSAIENLVCEQLVFDLLKKKQQSGLLFWKNTDSIIIGRNQNPWKECHLQCMEQHGVMFFRRQSGGGAVYHDLGNLNITFFSPRSYYNSRENMYLLQDSLRDMGVFTELKNNGIFIQERKISGSAFRMERQGAYHHLTLLCATDLDKLWLFLDRDQSSAWDKVRGTASQYSSVCNITEVHPTFCMDSFMHCLTDRFAYKIKEKDTQVIPYTYSKTQQSEQHFHNLSSWKWKYANTPQFSVMVYTNNEYYRVSIEKSFISLVEKQKSGEFFVISSQLQGRKLPFSQKTKISYADSCIVEGLLKILYN